MPNSWLTKCLSAYCVVHSRLQSHVTMILRFTYFRNLMAKQDMSELGFGKEKDSTEALEEKVTERMVS